MNNQPRKTTCRLLGTFALLVALLSVAACGNATPGDSAANSAATSASSANAASSQKEEQTPAEETLKPEDVQGYWVVQKSGGISLDEMLDSGMLNTFAFDSNGKFTITARILDSTLDRTGTYKIENGNLFVSVPKLEKQSEGKVSLSAKAIENAEVTIDGDTLRTKGISSDGSETVAKRVSEEQYQQYVEKVLEKAPKRPAIGEEVSTDTSTFTVNSLEFVDEVYPSDTSGYYSYLEHQDGKSYLLASVTYTNNGTEYAVPGYATQASYSVGENKYSAEVEVDGGSLFSKTYRVEAKDTAQIYIYCLVPDSVRDSGDVTLTWNIPNNQTYMNTYYKDSYPHDSFEIKM